MKTRVFDIKASKNPTFLWIPQYSLILSGLISVGRAMTDEILTLKEVAQYLKHSLQVSR